MRSAISVVAGLVGVGLVACGAAPDARESVAYVPPAAPANPVAAVSPHAVPPEEREAAGAAAPLQPAATPISVAPAAPPPAAPPPEAAAPAAPAPAPAAPPAAAQPMAAAAGSAAAATPAAAAVPVGGFDAGSGMMQSDGKTVVYHIPDGTGGKDWNPKDKPIRVGRGMTLRLVDDDKSTKSGGHWLHTNGQPCGHGVKAIGAGFDCVVKSNAPYGVVSGTFEHNVANGIGRVYIEVVEANASEAD